MAILKCKMCGGDLNITEGMTVVECEYCGSMQTVPTADNEKKLTLFARANRLRAGCEFDKAAGVYETIVADFPEEAEAYWGLVLCKFGIEYVDDPVTGKKIPTCHRSSFNGVLEDGDFEQTLENADVMARKVYREEAKVIENLRKGIIAVSANEQPYDIFICYKETAENGERTLDSVLAQDIYDALTRKGYQVFFSRITLEDKLGVEYEPYIFAALNSAKIMLAIGTDYEYYNAVWVKNEWSRYLKLMEQDKTRHLIPCFKGIDAYDMPKEFARLQAQDLGKVGAMQDLLRGIEKIIPREKPTVVAQEKVSVGGSGNNKIASLLDRGNMALEDGDWAKADSFFEDVLNNDSKNAQAYLGKTLAQEQCRTIDAFVRKRKDAIQNVHGETLQLQPDEKHIAAAVERFSLKDYVTEDSIRALYQFDLSYHSDVAERLRQYQNEEKYWANHKQLSRAEKFAMGAVAENLAQEKKALFAALKDRVQKAKAAEATEKKKVQDAYARHLKQADAQAEVLYQQGVEQKNASYQQLLQIAKTSNDVDKLTETAQEFEVFGDYQDSRNLAAHCRKRAAEEQAKLDAETERQRVLQEKAAKERAAKHKKIGIISGIVVMLAIVVTVVVAQVIIPNGKYNDAVALVNAGQLEEAIAIFETLDGYKDSVEQIGVCKIVILDGEYVSAIALKDTEQYEDAITALQALNGYKDSAAQIVECKYLMARALMDTENSIEASKIFVSLEDYKDSKERLVAFWDEFTVKVTLATGFYHTVGLKTNGTVVAVGNNDYNQCDVSGWTDIVTLVAGGYHTVGLKANGTVVAVGNNDYDQCNVSGWTDIVTLVAGGYHTVGLKADGTVVAVGKNDYGQCDVSGWTDIVALATGGNHTVGLKADGTVVAVGSKVYGQCDVSDWSNIMTIAAGGAHTVGLKSDNTVVATGYRTYDQSEVSGWKNIVLIADGSLYAIGLKADGTAVAVSNTDYDQCDVSGWTDIVAIDIGNGYAVGLKVDGTVIATGSNYYGQCDVSDWSDIKLP